MKGTKPNRREICAVPFMGGLCQRRAGVGKEIVREVCHLAKSANGTDCTLSGSSFGNLPSLVNFSGTV